MPTYLTPAIKIGGKVFEGSNHGEAINKAKQSGEDVSKVNRERDGKFEESDGTLIDRKEAKKEFGISHSHELKGKGRKFCIVTADFSGLGYGLDKRNENDEIIFATNPDMEKLKDKGQKEAFDNIGKGLIKRFELKDVMQRRQRFKDWYFVLDGNHSVEENELLRKEGFKVCLGGKRAYDLENDREMAIKLAEQYGLPSPDWKAFKSPDEGIKYLESNSEKAYVCKPNGAESYLTTVPRLHNPKKANENMRTFIKSMGFKDYILQEMKKGIEVNVECFFVKGEPKSASVNLECKRVSSDDTGSMVGCAFDCVKDIAIDSKLVKDTIGKMFPYYKENKITGFGDVNVIIGDTDTWSIEKCERFGYNHHVNYFKNIEKKDALNTLADMCDGTYKPETRRIWGASVTAFVDYPHGGIPMQIPEEIEDKCFLMDGMVKDGIQVQTGIKSGNNELVIVCGSDYEMKGAFSDALEKCDKLRDEIVNLDFRKDCIRDDYDSAPIKRWRALSEMGFV